MSGNSGSASTMDRFRDEMDVGILGITIVALAVFTLARLAVPGPTKAAVRGTKSFLLNQFGWFFLAVMVVFVLFCLFLIVGPWGSIRLGGPEATPSYTYPAYFAMFFSAGIAAGIVFWGPAEALFHFSSPPPFVGASGGSAAAATGALQTVMFHWGISAWSAYVVVGVPIAYYAYNRGAPLRVSSLLVPFLGKERLDGPIGKLVDLLAMFATIGGVATSVTLVSQQFTAGINYQWGVATGNVDSLLVVAALTIAFTVSVVTGVNRGIRRIAAVNFGLFGLLAVAILVTGPIVFVLSNGVSAFVGYVVDFVSMSLYPLLGGSGSGFYTTWTLFYWIWWFSWAPFAGLFLAAISRGRTIRTVAFTGVVATSLATLVWFVIVGGTSLGLQQAGVDILGVMSSFSGGGETVAAFPLLGALPLGGLLVFLFMALIITFIVTSADTSTLSVAILATEHGVAPSTGTRVFWGVLQGAVAAGLLVVGGAGSLQSAAIITGGPFAVISLLGVIGLAKAFYTAESGTSILGVARDAFRS